MPSMSLRVLVYLYAIATKRTLAAVASQTAFDVDAVVRGRSIVFRPTKRVV